METGIADSIATVKMIKVFVSVDPVVVNRIVWGIYVRFGEGRSCLEEKPAKRRD